MIARVLTYCWIHYPALRRGLVRLTPVERAGLGTVAVDQYWRLYFDPAALERWGVTQSARIIAEHELAHLVRRHHARAKAIGAEPRLWNISADAEINDDLEGMPDGTIVPSKIDMPDGLLAEQYYAGVSQQTPEQPPPGAQQSEDSAATGEAPERDLDGSGSEGSDAATQASADPQPNGQADGEEQCGDSTGDGEGDGSDAAASNAAPGQGSDSAEGAADAGREGDASRAGNGAPRSSQSHADSGSPSGEHNGAEGSSGCGGSASRPGSGACSETRAGHGASRHHDHEPGCCGGGSGVTGVAAPWEEPPPGVEGAAPGLHPAEVEVAIREIAESIRSRSDTPGHWKRWAQSERPAERHVTWQAILRREVGRADVRRGRQDYSYARPSRRQFGRNVVLPACVERPPNTVVVVDTSGSRSDAELAADVRDVEQICRVLGGQVTMIAVDAEVHWTGRVWSRSEARRRLKGGGGTDMGVGIAEAARRNADLCIVLTDGWTPWPVKAPRCRTIVVTTDKRGPAWARTIEARRT